MKRILLVDENKYLLDGLSMQLQATLYNCQIMTANDGMKAMKMLEAGPVDLLMTDLRTQGMDGYELLEHAKKRCPHVLIYAMTSYNSPSIEEHARSLGARHCISKPFNFEKIAQFISHELNIEVAQMQAC